MNTVTFILQSLQESFELDIHVPTLQMKKLGLREVTDPASWVVETGFEPRYPKLMVFEKKAHKQTITLHIKKTHV